MDIKKWKVLERPNKRQIPEQQEAMQLMQKIGFNSAKAILLFIYLVFVRMLVLVSDSRW